MDADALARAQADESVVILATCETKKFYMELKSANDFVRGLGTHTMTLFDAMSEIDQVAMLTSVARATLQLLGSVHALVDSVHALAADRPTDPNHTGRHEDGRFEVAVCGEAVCEDGMYDDLPPVLPHQLARCLPVHFLEVIAVHRERLEVSFSAQQMGEVQAQQRSLRSACHAEPAL